MAKLTYADLDRTTQAISECNTKISQFKWAIENSGEKERKAVLMAISPIITGELKNIAKYANAALDGDMSKIPMPKKEKM